LEEREGSKQERQAREKDKKTKQASPNPHVLGFGRCLSSTKPHVLPQKGAKNARNAKFKLNPSYPKAHTWEEAVPLLLSKRKKIYAQESLEIEKEG
jgi:hypothetical protein